MINTETIAAHYGVPTSMLTGGRPHPTASREDFDLYQRHLTQIQASVIQKQAAHFAAVARSLRTLKYRTEIQEESAALYRHARELMGLEV